MKFRYSIIYPDKMFIERKNSPITGDEVLNIAKNYPWIEQFELSDKLNSNYPSLDFICIDSDRRYDPEIYSGEERSFRLQASWYENKKLEFTLYFGLPYRVKVLFGILGETEKYAVESIMGFSFEESLKYLEIFVNGNYKMIEEIYKNRY